MNNDSMVWVDFKEVDMNSPKSPEVEFTKDDHNLSLNGYYHIAWDRIDTEMKLLVWVLHLSEKTWMKREDLDSLVHIVCKRFGWNIPWAC